ncbi:MAG: DNA-binding protein, partial [Desulfobacterales bacterium]
MVSENFVCKCIADSIDGLCDGLSHFSGPSRAAIVYITESKDPVRIYDPQGLLRGHEPILEELYLKSNDWIRSVSIASEKKKFSDMLPEKNLQLAGIISYGGRSG